MRKHSKSEIKETAKKVWDFIWNDDSIWSWIANVALAFILIKFIVYPLMGLLLGTQLPVVAVISESMSHTPTDLCVEISPFTGECVGYDDKGYEICGKEQNYKKKLNFDNYWFTCGNWYEDKGISKEEFSDFPLNDGFEKGDVIVLRGADPENLEVGDVLVFVSNLDSLKARPYPIIHRIVDIQETSEGKLYSTKGDHNAYQISTLTFNEKQITEFQVIGRGVARIPFVGYLKIWFVDLLDAVGLV